MPEPKEYLCPKWPNLNFVIDSAPTKDRSGKAEGVYHHIQFSNGKFSTNDAKEIKSLESHEFFKNGTIVSAHIQAAKERAEAKERLEKEAAKYGWKLAKA